MIPEPVIIVGSPIPIAPELLPVTLLPVPIAMALVAFVLFLVPKANPPRPSTELKLPTI